MEEKIDAESSLKALKSIKNNKISKVLFMMLLDLIFL